MSGKYSGKWKYQNRPKMNAPNPQKNKKFGSQSPNRFMGKPKCKKFGCGKTLTSLEYLMGDYCFTHQQEINQNKI